MGKGTGKENRRVRAVKAAGLLAGLLVLTALACFLTVYGKRQRRERLIEAKGPVTVVVFGDSIWDMVRDDTGIEAVLESELKKAEVYNCAIMGTSAAYRRESGNEAPEDTALWNGKSLAAIMTAQGESAGNLPEGLASGMRIVERETGITDVPLEKAEYFVIAYGLNDYFSAVPRESDEPLDLYSYAGALRTAVERLRQINSTARIFLLSQTYCQGYSYGKVDSESDYKDYGGGTGPDYVDAAEKVAEETGCVFVNNYRDMGINIHNGPKYLSDATHLTAYGRKKYAKNLAKYLLEDYEQCVKP